MKITKKNINNVPVTFIKTNKFKTIVGTLYFKTYVTKDNVSKRSLLRNILIESCKKYNTSEKLYLNILENYDAYYSTSLSRLGNHLINSFTFSSLVDKYTKEGNLANVIDTFCEIVFNPFVCNNKFDSETFNRIKELKKVSLKKALEAPDSYLERKLAESYKNDKAYTYLTTIEKIDEITEESLYEEYLEMINNSDVELIIAGDIEDEDVFNKILEKITINKKIDENFMIDNRDDLKYEEIKEKFKSNQSILNMVLFTKDLTKYETNYVMPIYKAILGGVTSSRLFNIIREENKLAYYAFARLEKDDNLIEIIMGVEEDNYEKALKLTNEIIKNMETVTEKEINEAKKTLITNLNKSQDNLFNVLSLYNNFKSYKIKDKDEYIENLTKVNKNDIKEFSKKVYPRLVYFLKGGLK